MSRDGIANRLPRHAKDRGAVAVEFALVIIPLLILVSGIIQFGIGYNAQETLTAIARSAARQVAVCGSSCVSQASVSASVRASGVSVQSVSITPCPAGADQTNMATVRITAPVGGVSNLLRLSFTVTGRASMPCGG